MSCLALSDPTILLLKSSGFYPKDHDIMWGDLKSTPKNTSDPILKIRKLNKNFTNLLFPHACTD